MRKTVLFAFMMILVTAISCTKDPDQNGNDIQTKDNITIGNYEGMIVTRYDSIDWFYYENIKYEDTIYIMYSGGFTIKNGNDSLSFGLQTLLQRNPIASLPTDPLNYYEISIDSYDLAFHYNTVSKDAYLHTDSTIIQTDSVTLIYVDEIISCNQIDESDPYQPDYSYVSEVLIQLNKNEVLNKDDSFALFDYPINLFQSNAVFPTQVLLDTTDVTMYGTWTFANEECFNFPLDEEFYIGFKYSNESRDRIGWIKLIIEPDANGHYYVKPLESAIQE